MNSTTGRISMILVATALSITVSAGAALAQQTFPTQIIRVPNSPIALTSCKVTIDGGEQFFSNVLNRTNHQLLTAQIQYKAYDTDGAPIGSTNIPYNVDPPLAAGDSNLYPSSNYIRLAEPVSAISHFTCRALSATFTGRKTWNYGQRWREKLSPLP